MSRVESEKGLRAYFTYIHLDLFRSHPSMCKLLYMIVTHYQNKVFFCTIFMDLLLISLYTEVIQRFNNVNKVVYNDT